MAQEGVTVYSSPEFIEELDEKIHEEKNAGKIPKNASRSKAVRGLLRGWMDGDVEYPDEPDFD